VLNELQSVVPFELAFVLTEDEAKSGHLKIFDLLSSGPSNLARGASYFYKGSIIEKVFKQETSLLVDNTGSSANTVDRELFSEHGCTSCLLAPLKTDGIVTGILALSAREVGMFYNAQKLITWIANGLSLAIERNRLSAAVVKRNRELDTIRQVGSALASSTFDISKVLKYTRSPWPLILKLRP
jgi:transcriptional regulator with GAF, ATPase, and Fis domain